MSINEHLILIIKLALIILGTLPSKICSLSSKISSIAKSFSLFLIPNFTTGILTNKIGQFLIVSGYDRFM